MSRFADPDAKERLVLGPCECPGAPHTEDWIDMRTEIGAEAFEEMGQHALRGHSVAAVALLIVDWNLLDHDGSTAPVDADHIGRLYKDSFEILDGWINGHVRTQGILPNQSAARSRNTSRPSGSRPIPIRKKAG